jgi:hypothetical protein
MNPGGTSTAILGFIGGMALGVWIGAEMTADRGFAAVPLAAVQPDEAPAEPIKAMRRHTAKASRVKVETTTPSAASEGKLVMTIPVSAPRLHDRLKPVLPRGTKIRMAVEGFTDAEQFATIAHAARNTQVPFILLKHRVLIEGQSLEAAIRASKPGLDAATEVERARAEARHDIAALTATD